ncbi:MAG TPA: hypothetical protein VEK08_24700 [Planctomycetota bacterium]|nr:hypothetical protein [Planctomycetota bacterium]
MKQVSLLWTLPLLVVVLTGCGSPPREVPSARKDIDEAQMAMDSSRSKERVGDYDMALGDLRRAREAINKGKTYAEDTDLSKLNSMDDEVRKRMMDLETRRLTKASEPVKPKAVAAAPKTEDPEEKKKREEAAAEAKRLAAAAKEKAALDATFKVAETKTGPAKVKEDDEPVPADVKTAAKKKADGEEEVAEGEAPKRKTAVGPFPELLQGSPPLEIVKLTTRGKFAIAYFQLYNKDNNGRRIMNVAVIFKNANGQEMINPLSVATFSYSGFKPDITNPTEQSTAAAVTSGSHQITGGEGMQLAAVGEHDRAGDVKSVGVIVVFDDGTKVSAAGPAAGAEAAAPVKGLKLK